MPDCWQRSKINKLFSLWSALLREVPQGSLLGPIFFNTSLNDLLQLLRCDVCNFSDDAAPYVCD